MLLSNLTNNFKAKYSIHLRTVDMTISQKNNLKYLTPKKKQQQLMVKLRIIFFFTHFRRKAISIQKHWRDYLKRRKENFAVFLDRFEKAEKVEARNKLKKMDAIKAAKNKRLQGKTKAPNHELSMEDRILFNVRYFLFFLEMFEFRTTISSNVQNSNRSNPN